MPRQPEPRADVASRSQPPWRQMHRAQCQMRLCSKKASLCRRPGGLRIFYALTVCLLFLWQATVPATGQEPSATEISARSHLSHSGCSELLINGDFEVTDLRWSLFGTAFPPSYSSAEVFAGDRSLRLGNVDSANLEASNGIHQDIHLPNSAQHFVLNFRYWPVHEGSPGSDIQFLDIYDTTTGVRLSRPWSQLSNEQEWIFNQVDLTHFQGRDLRIEFGVRNDGSGGRTALYLDNVSLLACEPGATPFLTPSAKVVTPLPSLTPQPIATPLPTGCIENDILKNGGFEDALDSSANWIAGDAPTRPVLSNEHSKGGWALLLGNSSGADTQNLVSYSSVRQLIELPSNASTASVRWSHLSRSQESTTLTPSRWQDRQELILLKPSLTTERILYRSRKDTTTWDTETIDLTAFLGNAFYLYFNVFNDGNGERTWMFLDDVQVIICYLNTTSPAAGATRQAPMPTQTQSQQGAGAITRTARAPTQIAEATVSASPTLPVRGTIIAVGVTTPSALIQKVTRSPSTRAPLPASVSVWQRFRRISQTAQGQTFLLLLLLILVIIGYLRFRESRGSSP